MKFAMLLAAAVVLWLARHAGAQSLASPETPVSVPEPTTGLLLGLGAAVAYGVHRLLKR